MRIKGLLLCAILFSVVLASTLMPASATMRISEDRGGQIGNYLQAFAMLRSSGENVVIDGNCLSACTLILGLIPHSRICATPRARFGFHAAWMPDVDGQPVTSPLGTQALWNVYPTMVRHWIRRHGGLSRRMIYMQGRDLRGIVAYCDSAHGSEHASTHASKHLTQRAHAHTGHHFSSDDPRRPLRYSSANAAGERR
jgi:hypothetical protein